MRLYLIDCIRPVLSLEAEARVLGVDCSTLAPQSAIQEVARVKLDARLGGVYFQDPPTSSMAHPGDKDKSYLSFPGRKRSRNSFGAGTRPGYTGRAKRIWEIRIGWRLFWELPREGMSCWLMRTLRNNFSDDVGLGPIWGMVTHSHGGQGGAAGLARGNSGP